MNLTWPIFSFRLHIHVQRPAPETIPPNRTAARPEGHPPDRSGADLPYQDRADVFHHGQVVGDEHIGQAETLLTVHLGFDMEYVPFKR